ncbi:MAG: VOC family protein, partial [Anaeromyxobacteraceae bacterium]
EEPGAARGLGCIGLTVSDADRAAGFDARVLDFHREVEVEVAGEAWERLQGVFGPRARTVRVRSAPSGWTSPSTSCRAAGPCRTTCGPNDRSFQHAAIVVSDLDEAYRRLRAARVERTAAAPGLEPERRQDPRLLLPRSEDVDMDQWEAGFTDREGRFYNRQEAAHLFGVRGRLGSESYFAGAANPTLEAGHLEAWRKPALTSYWRAPVASSRVSTYACGTTLEHPCRAA